ncbi:hypothetical protein D3C78_1521320 [compost metagenome]
MIIGTVGRSVCCTYADAFADVISRRQAPAVAVLFLNVTAVVLVFTLVLNSEVQTVNQTEEVVVTVSRNAVGTASHEVVGVGVSIATELWQHICPAFHVVQYAIVTAVVE